MKYRDQLEQKLIEMQENYEKQIAENSEIMRDINELKEAYESVIKKPENMEFGEAIKALKDGKKVAREGWHGKDMFLMYVDFTTNPEKTRGIFLNHYRLMPTIYIAVSEHEIYPWNASQADILSDDWIVIGDKPDLYLHP